MLGNGFGHNFYPKAYYTFPKKIFLKKKKKKKKCRTCLKELMTYNPGQAIWNKIEKSSETEQGKKILISTLACFLTAIAKV